MRSLIVGGSKSGKSSYAQTLAASFKNTKYYWACMEPRDDEDKRRIEAHIKARDGLNFITIECPRNIADNIPEEISGGTVLFDSVTALLSNEMFCGNTVLNVDEKLADDLLTLSLSCENFICVADDIFSDGVEYDEITEEFRRELAFILKRLAKEFDRVCEVTAGIPHIIKGNVI